MEQRTIEVKEIEIPILEDLEDGKYVTIQFVDGKKYKLQHPGVRSYLNWKEKAGRTSIEKKTGGSTYLLDEAFKYCVFPIEHDFKPNLDNLSPKIAGVWEVLLVRFLEGQLE